MDDIARLPATDRADLFAVSGTGRGLSSEMIEKDFWVCWTLKRVFTLSNPPSGLLFKGGTSLSKVFGIIERFSEDVDLSFDRAGLGFGGENDPLNATTGKRRKHGREALIETCQRVILEQFLPQLVTNFSDALGEKPSSKWGLALADDDPDGRTVSLSNHCSLASVRRTNLYSVGRKIGNRCKVGPLAGGRGDRLTLRCGGRLACLQGIQL